MKCTSGTGRTARHGHAHGITHNMHVSVRVWPIGERMAVRACAALECMPLNTGSSLAIKVLHTSAHFSGITDTANTAPHEVHGRYREERAPQPTAHRGDHKMLVSVRTLVHRRAIGRDSVCYLVSPQTIGQGTSCTDKKPSTQARPTAAIHCGPVGMPCMCGFWASTSSRALLHNHVFASHSR